MNRIVDKVMKSNRTPVVVGIILAVCVLIGVKDAREQHKAAELAAMPPAERYAVQHPDKVLHTVRPRNCDWGYAPLGIKGCHYNRVVEFQPCSDGNPFCKPDDPATVIELWEKVQD